MFEVFVGRGCDERARRRRPSPESGVLHTHLPGIVAWLWRNGDLRGSGTLPIRAVKKRKAFEDLVKDLRTGD
ncbi:unnamed protein product, partial [Ascophyllum nodosum]